MNELDYWLWLSKIELNSKLKKDLVLNYRDPERIFNLTKKELAESNISNENIHCLLDKKFRKKDNTYKNYIDKNGIGILTILSKNYPRKLLEIYDSPIVLFYKGNIDLLTKKILAIVGSRECSDYGKKTTKYFANQLAKKDICIISGLAKGIDTFAHESSMRAIGKTIAVLGAGLDIVYPKENEKLYESIIDNNGLILSEYILGTKPLAINFPKRNRIISALADGILVVEASKKSGAIITVDYGLEQGKDIYAVPGNITSYNSMGTNELLKQGAKIVTNINDILEEIDI